MQTADELSALYRPIASDMDAVRAALQDLTYEQKQVILLKFMEGFSNQDQTSCS